MPMQDTTSQPANSISLMDRLRQQVQKYRTQIGLTVLILYVLLLGLGTIGEIWNVEWILDLPLFRPPGKY
jgi:hypothetical protein